MKRLGTLVLALCFSAGTAWGQAAQPKGDAGTERTITPPKTPIITTNRVTEAPKIDGHVDEPMWQQAFVADEFWQRDPNEGDPATEATEVRILYDDDALYVAFICYDSEPDLIQRRLTRRDRQVPSDQVEILIDSYNDGRTAFLFALNAAGVKVDALIQNDGNGRDNNWDAIWYAKTAQRADGWSAEFKIPFSALRFQQAAQQEWGLNLMRQITRKNEFTMWTFIPKGSSGFVSNFGRLSGLDGIKPARNLRVTPYALSGGTRWPDGEMPARTESISPEYRVGLDAQYALTNSSILTLTINPDFGQVEVDETVLNLSAFESFFPEKRPFFLEGTDIFQTVGSLGDDGPRTELFYTRRIGRQPTRFGAFPSNLDPNEWMIDKNPASTPIVGAAKLSGKSENGWSYGFINAMTQRTHKVFENAQGDQQRLQTEPLTNYAVARAQYELSGPASYVGAIATSVLRDGADQTDALSGGIDWQYNTAGYGLSTEGIVALTHRITPNGVQQGWHGQVRIGSFSNKHFIFQGGGNFSTADFNPNDIGFTQGNNNVMGFFWGQYRKLQPFGPFRTFRFNTSAWRSQVIEPWLREGNGLSSNFFVQWKNYWNTGVGINLNSSGFDVFESRGAGPYQSPNSTSFWGFISTDQRKNVSVNLNPNYSFDDFGRTSWGIGLPINFKIGTRTQFSVAPRLNKTFDGTGWAGNVYDAQGTPTAVFGKRDVDQISVTLRGLHTFTADFTLQAYAQYFWARGTYSNFEQLEEDGTLGPLAVAFNGNPNFNLSNVNINVIARYEYLPGSTVFLVWSHGRDYFTQDVNLGARDFFNTTFDRPATDVLLLKWTYSMGL